MKNQKNLKDAPVFCKTCDSHLQLSSKMFLNFPSLMDVFLLLIRIMQSNASPPQPPTSIPFLGQVQSAEATLSAGENTYGVETLNRNVQNNPQLSADVWLFHE